MSDADSRPPFSADAEELFAAYAGSPSAGIEADFEALCRAHAAHAAELRAMKQRWDSFQSLLPRLDHPGTLSSLSSRLRRAHGENVDPVVSLGGDQPETDPGFAGSLLHRLRIEGPRGTRYKLLGEVARGGMGTVLRIWDDELRRTLAMKVVLGREDPPVGRSPTPRTPGAHTGETPAVDPKTLGRFLEEAQITGQLDHPGIVPVHELGLASDGRVYFTMRLVKGRDLKHVYDLVRSGEEGWSQTRALGVLLKVCEAMSYAHSKGVIHRDLKPANVMVGKYGEVYVMDWGLARVQGREDKHDLRLKSPASAPSTLSAVRTDRGAQRGETPDSPLVTMDGDVVGTPSFMAPEQAKGQLDRLGPHSDVYAVGAMLYQLLGGEMPFVPADARVSQHTVLMSVIHGPPKPLFELAPRTPPELIAICEKAMARDLAGRYRDMQELADDLRAYLEHRVVKAHETGTWAETRKWIERNKPLAAACAAAAMILVAGAVTSSFFAVRASERAADARGEARRAETALAGEAEQRRSADEQRVLAERSAAVAKESHQRAGAEAQKAKAVNRFLEDMLGAANPETGRKPGVTVREVLDDAVATLDQGSLRDLPDVEASVRATLGETYFGLGLFPEAEANLLWSYERRRALHGEDSEAFADSVYALAELRHHQGRVAEGAAGYRQAMASYAKILGPDSEAVGNACGSLANLLRDLARYEEAEPLFRRAIEIAKRVLGERSNPVAVRLNNLGIVLHKTGRPAEAESLFSESLSIHRDVHGEAHIEFGIGTANLANAIAAQGRLAEAEPLARQGVDIVRAAAGPDTVYLANPLEGLAANLRRQGKLDEAIALASQALEIRKQRMGPHHPLTATTMSIVAGMLNDAGKSDEAAPLIDTALEIAAMTVDPNHPGMIEAWNTQASIRQALGRHADAIEPLQRALAIRRASHAGGDAGLGVSLSLLGLAFLDCERIQDAVKTHRQALAARRAAVPPNPALVAASLTELGSAMTEAGDAEDAMSHLLEAMEIRRSAEPEAGAPTANTLSALGKALLALGRPAEAEPPLVQCVEIRTASARRGSWSLANAQSLLGEAIAAQGRWDQAERLLLGAAQVLREQRRTPPVRRRNAIERVVELYRAWSKSDPSKAAEVERWTEALRAPAR